MRNGDNNNSGWPFLNLLHRCLRPSDYSQGDQEEVSEAEQQYYLASQNASEESRGERNLALAEVSKSGYNLANVSEEFKKDREIVLAAVNQSGGALQFADKALKGDKEIVLAAVRKSEVAFQYASEELKGNKEVVLEAVKKNGYALQHASEDLRADREVVLAAVNQNGEALRYASEDLRADREVVLVAVSQDGWALSYASEKLREDPDVVLKAIIKDPSASIFAGGEIKIYLTESPPQQGGLENLQDEITKYQSWLESKKVERLFLFHNQIKAIIDGTANDQDKKTELYNVINGSFIKDTGVMEYLGKSIGEADDNKKKEEIEKFCKKHPEKSPAILSYLLTSYLLVIENTDSKNIDPKIPNNTGDFEHFDKKLFEEYQKEKTPNAQTSGASAESQSSNSQQP